MGSFATVPPIITPLVSTRNIRIIVILSALVVLLPSLGAVRLFDWDEINFAESARATTYKCR